MVGPPKLTPLTCSTTSTRSVLPFHTHGTLRDASSPRQPSPANRRAKPVSRL
ncbi:hypothetical protein FOMPIDRAFT_1026450 [Fomitopsis schrenkii]|uniref:Uncharacterized protein n=1 Tax=Fomitopsis schrenkii TaxID=2126942 RepID=S8EVM6_FOMSC|nr:hypothetical protein FOMPIDRAFT_1026450 [Fomitopsis schrenkii]